MKKARKLYTSFEQLPLTLNADDIAAYLNISRGNASRFCIGKIFRRSGSASE